MKSKTQYRLLIVLLCTIAFFLIACGDRSNTEKPEIKPTIDFSTVPDGTYRGRFTYGAFNYIVDVVVADGKVTEIIAIQNKDNEPSEMAEGVFDNIIAAQSVDIDGISGATASSKALIKAVENSVKHAQQK
ncbi:MAG: FMN-binding protein [Clostridiales bacterium]|jgi:uncharacterized protein with FMN-binding domain|nr:FMN-binding protein [Clostridiales bacterium]